MYNHLTTDPQQTMRSPPLENEAHKQSSVADERFQYATAGSKGTKSFVVNGNSHLNSSVDSAPEDQFRRTFYKKSSPFVFLERPRRNSKPEFGEKIAAFRSPSDSSSNLGIMEEAKREITRLGSSSSMVRKSLRQLDQGFQEQFKESKEVLELWFRIDNIINYAENCKGTKLYLGLQSGSNSEIKNIGMMLFNIHPLKGLAFLIAVGILRKEASSVARFLFNTSSLSPDYTGKCELIASGRILVLPDNQDSTSIFSLFSHMFQFKGKQILEALKLFLRKIKIKHEVPLIDHLCHIFARAFHLQNKDSSNFLSLFPTIVAAHSLSFALVLLSFELQKIEKELALTNKQRYYPFRENKSQNFENLLSLYQNSRYSSTQRYQSNSETQGDHPVVNQIMARKIEFMMQCKGMRDGEDFTSGFLEYLFQEVVRSNPLKVWKSQNQEAACRYHSSNEIYGHPSIMHRIKAKLQDEVDLVAVQIIILPASDILVIKAEESVAPLHMVTLSGLKMVVYKRRNECVLKSRNENKGLMCLTFRDEVLRIVRQRKYRELFKSTETSSKRRSILLKKAPESVTRIKRTPLRTMSPEEQIGEILERELRSVECGLLECRTEIRLQMDEKGQGHLLTECSKLKNLNKI